MRNRECVEIPVARRDEIRPDRVADVRRRLESGELDSEAALVETALALLDGDLGATPPTAGSRRGR